MHFLDPTRVDPVPGWNHRKTSSWRTTLTYLETWMNRHRWRGSWDWGRLQTRFKSWIPTAIVLWRLEIFHFPCPGMTWEGGTFPTGQYFMCHHRRRRRSDSQSVFWKCFAKGDCCWSPCLSFPAKKSLHINCLAGLRSDGGVVCKKGIGWPPGRFGFREYCGGKETLFKAG